MIPQKMDISLLCSPARNRVKSYSFNRKKGVIKMKQRLKVFLANFIWKIAAISPKWGNRVMDFIGYENYVKVAKTQTLN